jgi:hypothetical protein
MSRAIFFNFADSAFVPFEEIHAAAHHGDAQILLIGISGHIQHFEDDRSESLGRQVAGRRTK